jgi:nitrate/nitrite transporter NarK
LSFAVWMLWSVVVVHLPAAGFRFSHQPAVLAGGAARAVRCATLRIFYAFAVPVFGGRRFTTLATASLLLPALGIGLRGAGPDHALTSDGGPGAAVRPGRRQFRQLDGAHQLLLSRAPARATRSG